MSAPESFEIMSANLPGCTPALGRPQDDHGPARSIRDACVPALPLVRTNFLDAMFHSRRHGLVHAFRVRSLHKVGGPAVASHQVLQFFVADARQQGGIVDFVSVQMDDGHDGSVANGTQEFADMP